MFTAFGGFAELMDLPRQRDFLDFLRRLQAGMEGPATVEVALRRYFEEFYGGSSSAVTAAFSFWDDDPSENRAILIAAAGFDYVSDVYPKTLRYGEGVVGRLLSEIRAGGNPEPLLAREFGVDIAIPACAQAAVKELNFAAAIAFPIVLNGTIAGVLKLYSRLPLSPEVASSDERIYLEQLRLSMLLANARSALSSSLSKRLHDLLGHPQDLDITDGAVATHTALIQGAVKKAAECISYFVSASCVDVHIGSRLIARAGAPPQHQGEARTNLILVECAETASASARDNLVKLTVERTFDGTAFSAFDRYLVHEAAEVLAKYLSKVILRDLEFQRKTLLEKSKRLSSEILEAVSDEVAIQSLLAGIRSQFPCDAAVYYSAEGQFLHAHTSIPESLASAIRSLKPIEFAPAECEHAPSDDWHLDLCGSCGRCQGSAAVAAARKHPVWVRKENLPQPSLLDNLGFSKVRNELALPVFWEQQVFGVVVLYRADETPVDGGAWHFATSLCDIAALALYNRQLLRLFMDVQLEENKGEMALDVVHAVVPNNTALQIEAQLIEKAVASIKNRPGDRVLAQKQAQIAIERVSSIYDIIRQQENILHPLRVLHKAVESLETAVDVRKAIRDLVNLNTRTFDQKRIKVRPVSQGVPRPIRAREMDVYLILWNLLHNAAKFTRGNRPSTLTITEQFSRDCVMVKVRDEGIGIPPENRTRIWENDFSTPAPGADRHTSGRGLFTVAHLVSRIAGSDIQMTSVVNKGTEFTWIVHQLEPV